MKMKPTEKELRIAIVAVICWLAVIAMAVVCGADAVLGAEPYGADVRVKAAWSGYEGHGSGTAIYSDNRGSWVLTAEHNVRDSETGQFASYVGCQGPSGPVYPAKWIAGDSQLDVAMVWTTLANVEARPMASKFQPSESVWVTGWPGTGQRYRWTHTSLSSCNDGGLFGFAGQSITGQSGGAIVNSQGFVVGVVSASDTIETIAPCGEHVFQFVRETVQQHGYEVQCRNGFCPIIVRPRRIAPRQVAPTPTPARPQPQQSVPQPAQPERSIVVSPKLDAMADRIGALDKGKQDRGDYVTRGELPDLGGYARQADLQRIETEIHTRHQSLLERIGALASGASAGSAASKLAVGALGISGPAGWALIAAGTVGGWLMGRIRKRRRKGEGGKRKPDAKKRRPSGPSEAHTLHQDVAQVRRRREEAAAGDADFTFREQRQPIERDDREARELLRLSAAEGRDPLQDALVGRLAIDRLDAIADSDRDPNEAQWADGLRRELKERFNEIAPTKFQVA